MRRAFTNMGNWFAGLPRRFSGSPAPRRNLILFFAILLVMFLGSWYYFNNPRGRLQRTATGAGTLAAGTSAGKSEKTTHAASVSKTIIILVRMGTRLRHHPVDPAMIASGESDHDWEGHTHQNGRILQVPLTIKSGEVYELQRKGLEGWVAEKFYTSSSESDPVEP